MNVSNSCEARIGVTAWRLALLALGGVVILTSVIAAVIAVRALAPAPPQHLIASADWSIHNGVLEHGVLTLRPAASSIGLALYPINSLTYTLQFRSQSTQIVSPTLATGVIYAAQDADHFSTFLISPDGYFMLSDYDRGMWHTREPWRAWPHIRRTGQPNRLRVECTARSCAFYVNDESTWQIAVQAAAKSIGVVARPLPAAPPGATRFDQIDLWP